MTFLGPEETQKTWRGVQKPYEEATGRRSVPQEGGGRACSLLVDLLTLIPTRYILKYYPYTIGIHKNTFSAPQAYVLVRSHLGAFSGTLSQGDSITEGLYTNLAALPMMFE